MNSFEADTVWVRAYERLWPDPIADDDPRRPVIAAEMRELRKADGLAAGVEAIGWWYNHSGYNQATRDKDVRRAMRRLKASKILEEAARKQG